MLVVIVFLSHFQGVFLVVMAILTLLTIVLARKLIKKFINKKYGHV